MRLMIKKIPKIGMRNFKTALSVFILFFLFELIGRKYPIYACIAAIISTKDTIEDSVDISKSRVIGTIIGGVVGGLFLELNAVIDFKFSVEILSTVGIVFVIYLCTLMGEKRSTSLSCITFLLILYTFKNVPGSQPILYATNRAIDTAIGVVVSLLVNKFIFPPKKSQKGGE